MEVNASGNPNMEVRKIDTTSPMLELIKYLINAFIFI